MGIANFNKSQSINSNIDASKFPFTTLGVLNEKHPGKDFKIIDMYINNKSKFGAAPVVIIDGYKINMPKHTLKDVQAMLKDPDIVMQINEGHAGFSIREYESHSRKCFTVTWKDM